MAFTRRFLKSLGLNEDQVEAVIDEHTAVTNELKKYKEDAEKLEGVQQELDDLKAKHQDSNDWKKKYEDEHTAFETYKSDTEKSKEIEKVRGLYKSMLKEANVDEKRFDAILKVTDFSNMKVTQEGKLANADKIAESIKQDWSGFIVTKKTEGQDVATPPKSEDNGTGSNAAYIRERLRARHESMYGKTETKGEGN